MRKDIVVLLIFIGLFIFDILYVDTDGFKHNTFIEYLNYRDGSKIDILLKLDGEIILSDSLVHEYPKCLDDQLKLRWGKHDIIVISKKLNINNEKEIFTSPFHSLMISICVYPGKDIDGVLYEPEIDIYKQFGRIDRWSTIDYFMSLKDFLLLYIGLSMVVYMFNMIFLKLYIHKKKIVILVRRTRFIYFILFIISVMFSFFILYYYVYGVDFSFLIILICAILIFGINIFFVRKFFHD